MMIQIKDFKKSDTGYTVAVQDELTILVDESPEGWILTLVDAKGIPVFPTVTTGFVVPGDMTEELREKALDKAVQIANELLERYEQGKSE